MNRMHITFLMILLCVGLVTTVSATPAEAYRPTATSTISYVDDSGFLTFAREMVPSHGEPPDLEGMIRALIKPMTDQIGAFFYVIFFGVPYLVLWIRQKNLLVPSILGILLGAWMIVKIPAAYTIPAVAFLAMIVAGGLYGIYAKRT